jgi:toxin YhaV
VFRKMLDRGNPPDTWKELLAAASQSAAKRRLTRATREG